MELINDNEQYYAVSKDGLVTLRNSGIVLGLKIEIHKLSGQVISSDVMPMDAKNLFSLYHRGIKVSTYIFSIGRQSLNDYWLKNEYTRALQIDYPLMKYLGVHNAVGNIILKCGETHYVTVGKIRLELSFTKDGALFLINPYEYSQYVELYFSSEIKINNADIPLEGSQYMNPGQYIMLHMSIASSLNIEYHIITEAIMINEPEYVCGDVETKLNNLLVSNLKFIPLLDNIGQFCQIVKPSEVEVDMVATGEASDVCLDLLTGHEPSPTEIQSRNERNQLTYDIITSIKPFDFDPVHQKVRVHLGNELLKSGVNCSEIDSLICVLQNITISMTGVKTVYDAVREIF